MNAKTTMVLIALIGVGLFALPQTTALFAGQHSFVNIDATGNQIECVKCHGDVNAELGSSTSLTTGTPGAHAAFKCEYCHRVEAGKASGDNAYADLKYTDGDVTRILVVALYDLEAMNIPDSMGTTTVSTTTVSGNPTAKMSVSPCYPAANCTANPSAVLLPLPTVYPNMHIVALYASGAPIDTSNATKNGLFEANKVTWNTTGATPVANLTGAGSRTSNPGSLYHAASLVSCLECHGGEVQNQHRPAGGSCNDCHYSSGSKSLLNIGAGGFGLTTIAGDTGTLEAHNEFVKKNDNITRFDTASNGACVACHTHVAVDITYQKPSTYKFDVNFWADGVEELGGFSAQGPYIESNSDGN